MDHFFIQMESAPSAQSVSEESITCVAVKEDRHQNIMSSVALKKGVEEPWSGQIIDLLGYRGITLKSDTEHAIIAFRNSIAAMCKAEGSRGDAVKGDKRVERPHRERGKATARNHQNNEVSYPKQDAGTTQ